MRKECMLIGAAMSGDRIVVKKEARNVLNYKDLTIVIQCMCNVKTKVIGTTGTISKAFIKYLSYVLGKHRIKELQKQQFWALGNGEFTLMIRAKKYKCVRHTAVWIKFAEVLKVLRCASCVNVLKIIIYAEQPLFACIF
jgi:hypothetical protein